MHLLILRLFFFDPNRPCMTMMAPFLEDDVGLAGSWRSYARDNLATEPYVRLCRFCTTGVHNRRESMSGRVPWKMERARMKDVARHK